MNYRLHLFLLSVGLGVAIGHTAMPPDTRDIRTMGCNIRKVQEDDRTHRWRVYVWADYGEIRPRWEHLYAIRESTQRRKAFIDCDDWLKLVEKTQKDGAK